MDENNRPDPSTLVPPLPQANNATARQPAVPSVPQSQPQVSDNGQTTVRQLNKESAAMPDVSPEFTGFFENMFGEVLATPEARARDAAEMKEQEINEIQHELTALEKPQEKSVEPVVTSAPAAQSSQSSVAGLTQPHIRHIIQHISRRTISASLTWLAMLASKVFKTREGDLDDTD